MTQKRKRISVAGAVQGVGFRPYVWKRAVSTGLSGWVFNHSSGVTLEIQGTEPQVNSFLDGFEEAAPPLARIDAIDDVEIPVTDENAFVIRESAMLEDESTPIAPDIATCADCLCEFESDGDRRFQYPFINCTNCGPRFTMIEDVPYDRPLTTMKAFVMCSQCQREYDDPSDRRFHAQPNACPACGPRVWFVTSTENAEDFESFGGVHETGPLAIECFRNAMRSGQIVAVKGIGGFHLVCDSGNQSAIETLRQRKGRIDKPFAVMAMDRSQAEAFAVVGSEEQRLLESKERPIVLLPKRRGSRHQEMLDAVAPGNDFVGVMLAYSPLHYLMMDSSAPLVVTSGNVSDEPIVRTNQEARVRLGQIADRYLLHNRDIHVVCDDSVVRCVDDSVLPIRRSRGYAPMPIQLKSSGPSVLAVGGELKSTFCVTKNDYAYVSQHIGDMGNAETLDALRRNVDHFQRLFHVQIEAVAADLHPGYQSTRWADVFARSLNVPLLGVQHHYAHAASLIAENQWSDDQPILACCFDGTGYGTDGNIWGGEFLIAGKCEFTRFAHLEEFPLPGGDSSIKRPYRTALSLLWANELPWEPRLPCVSACPSNERTVMRQQLTKNLNCVSTSSVGRLFDAVASLIGIRHAITYEAQAAMELESLASTGIDDVEPSEYAFDIGNQSTTRIGCRHLVQAICDDVVAGVDGRLISAKFHHAVVNAVVEVCSRTRDQTDINTVGLTGGVFQNVVLLRLAKARLIEAGFQVLIHRMVPPNDGGIALGQAFVARNRLTP